MSATYAFRDPSGDITSIAPDFGKPRPAHTLTPEAEAAVETMLRIGHARRAERLVSSLVTDVGNPPVTPYAGPIPTNAKRTGALAERHGFTVKMIRHATGVSLHAVNRKRGVGFAAHWIRGKTTGGTWHEKRERYVMIEDTRPVGVSETTRTGKAKHRAAGMGTQRLKLVASPRGIPCNITEIERRISA
jgi:hypothetical protein